MKCLNPACESVEADEINVSVNISNTEPEAGDIVYTGNTEYGECSDLIGTWCPDCETCFYVPNWQDIVLRMVDATPETTLPVAAG